MSVFAICLYKDTLNRQWTSLTGDCSQHPLLLEDRLDLSRDFGRKLYSLVSYLASELSLNPNSYQHPIVRAQLEQLLLTEILVNLPHSRSHLLRKNSGRVVPQTVRRVIDYIHAYPGEPITLSLLCHVSGVAGRTLNTHFRKYTGMSPVAYARHVRLAAVREEILAHGGDISVTQIATRWGFEHLSRFSQFYRSQFGELPSETLRKAGLPAQTT